MVLSKRSFLTSAGMALAGAALLSGCTSSKNGTTTTHTIDVAKINNYAQAGLNATKMIASALSVVPALAVYADPVAAIAATLGADLQAFTAATNGQVTVSIDNAGVMSVVNSVLTDLTKLLDIAQQIATSATAKTAGVTDAILKTINTVKDALATVVSVFHILTAGIVTGSNGTGTPMTEAQALAALNVK